MRTGYDYGHPRNHPRNVDRRLARARNFPVNTCPASRHAAIMGGYLIRGQPYAMLAEEPEHCGGTILSVVESLWKARTEIERLRARLGMSPESETRPPPTETQP